MLARPTWRLAPRRLPLSRPGLLRSQTRHARRYSTPAAGQAGSGPGMTGMLAPVVGELDRVAPSFDVRGDEIRILRTPTDFYETLKEKIRGAKKRIFLATLYIGKSEHELISTIQQSLRANPSLKLSILTDLLRGTRESPSPSCASLLAPLVSEFGPDRVEVRMYHTPNLTGLRKSIVPRRINEGWGLQHMKLYGVDDEIILSGANLSQDYFTNRQDRYHLFSSSQITNFFSALHSTVSSLSFLVSPADSPSGFALSWPSSNLAPNPLDQPRQFVKASSQALTPLVTPSSHPPAASSTTRVYLLAQLSQLLRPDSSTELPAITHLLRTLASPRFQASRWTFTAGYFNPAPSLTTLLLSTCHPSSSSSSSSSSPDTPPNTVITAHPHANGFFNSSGVSALLPPAYTHLLRAFLKRIHSSSLADRIVTKEWRRGMVGEPGGWTYHAKGLWVTLPGDANPAMSVVGSSNYTKRSYSLDLEAGALIVTADEDLKRRLGEEERWLQEWSDVVTRDDLARNERRVGLKVRIAMWIVSLVGGAL